MDSQEKSLEQTMENEKNVEVTPNEATAQKEQVETTDNAAEAENASEQRKVYKTKAEVVERIKEIAHAEEIPQKDEVDYLKTVFYKLHFAEREADMKAYLDAGGDPAAYQVKPDENENAFKAEMTIIKERRAKQFEEQEKLKQDNLKKKLDIIEKIKNMATSPEEANKSYQEFKQLQQEWKEIKMVPAENANELWRNYQLYVEQFYDLLKLNSEAREYDFKKNLEIKTKLCEAAEKLADEDDVISAFHQLQELHQEYRESGPVAKELREGIWARFKAASTVINKKHQQHFEDIRAKEEDNLNKKAELCEKVEAIAKEENKTSADWENHTKQIIEIQTEWKTIGFAPQKMNVKIFERFRAACDDFFGRKSAYFTQMKKEFTENAEKKKALVEKAQAANAGARTEEHANMDKKKAVVEKLKALLENPVDDTQAEVRKLTEEYNSIGHVPYKEKDKIFNEYHEVLDKIFKELNISTARRRLNNFKTNLKNVAKRGEDALDNERTRLQRRAEQMKQEIQTYENNLGFLNASSKKGNSLIDEMNRKVQKLKDDLELIKQKIKAIDSEEK